MSGLTTQNVANQAPGTPTSDPGPGNLVGDARDIHDIRDIRADTDAARRAARAANVVVGKSSRARPNKGQLGWGNLSPEILQYVVPSTVPQRGGNES